MSHIASAGTCAPERPRWEIDVRLSALVGSSVRVGARAFAPPGWTQTGSRELISAGALVLSDGSTAVLPLFFEGRLLDFTRRIGVVHVSLGGLDSAEYGGEGVVRFRGGIATILRGPALVELAFPFHVEAIPPDASNYFADRQSAGYQLLLSLPEPAWGPSASSPDLSWPGNPA